MKGFIAMSATPPLRALTVDLWNTLICEPQQHDRASTRIAALHAALTAMGMPLDYATVQTAHTACGQQHAQLQATGRDCSAAAHVALFLAALGPEFTHEDAFTPAQRQQLTETYGDAAINVPPMLMEGAVEVLAELRGMGLRLALISNTGRTPGRVLRLLMSEMGIADAFDTLIFSDEVGLAKPNPAIFDLALAALEVTTAETLHVGDDLVLDWYGAHQADMSACVLCAECPSELAAPDLWVPRLLDVPTVLRQAFFTL